MTTIQGDGDSKFISSGGQDVPLRQGGPARADNEPTFFEQIGGHETFQRLVHIFYQRIAKDPYLMPMYPEHDMAGAEDRLRWFLEQYWGGPDTYATRRGRPRLRLRHQAYKINPRARDAWLGHMRAALDEISLPPLQDEIIWEYLDSSAHALLNTWAD